MIKLLNQTSNPVYIMNRDVFYNTEYKIMQKIPSLLKCYPAKINNLTELIYITTGMQPFKVVVPQMTAEEFLNAVRKVFETANTINNNEFLSLLHLNIEGTFIGKNDVALTYLPLTADNMLNGCTEQSIIEYIIECSELLPASEDVSRLKLAPKDSIAEFAKALSIKINPQKSLVLYNESNNHTITINKPSFTIGKKASAVDGAISYSENISRLHCKIESRNDKYYIEDMKSTNGTYVNGKPATVKTLLQQDDTVRLADITFKVQMMSTTRHLKS